MERNYRYGVPYAYASEVIEKNLAVDRDELKETGSDVYNGVSNISVADFEARFGGAFESSLEFAEEMSARRWDTGRSRYTGNFLGYASQQKDWAHADWFGLLDHVRRPEVKEGMTIDALLARAYQESQTASLKSQTYRPDGEKWSDRNIHLRPVSNRTKSLSQQENDFISFKSLADSFNNLGHRIIQSILDNWQHVPLMSILEKFNPEIKEDVEDLIITTLRCDFVRENLIRETIHLSTNKEWFGPIKAPILSGLTAFGLHGNEIHHQVILDAEARKAKQKDLVRLKELKKVEAKRRKERYQKEVEAQKKEERKQARFDALDPHARLALRINRLRDELARYAREQHQRVNWLAGQGWELTAMEKDPEYAVCRINYLEAVRRYNEAIAAHANG
jgi:hypothetical protein